MVYKFIYRLNKRYKLINILTYSLLFSLSIQIVVHYSLIIFYLKFGWMKYKQYSVRMESNTVPLFEKFAVLSVILPYYGNTRSCFLLLSELCRGSRDTLTQWYREFSIVMRPHWQLFYWGDDFKGEFPPCDLYKLDFDDSVPLNYNWYLNIN